MKNLPVIVSAVFISVLAGCCKPECPVEPIPSCANTLDSCNLDAIIAPWGEYKTPGIAAAVRDEDGDLWTGSVGLSELGTPLFDEMYFFTSSVPATVIITLKLVEEGVIALDDPFSKYLPEEIPNFSGDITIRHAFSYQSGTTFDWNQYDIDIPGDRSRVWTPWESGQFFDTPVHAPGEDTAKGNGPDLFLVNWLLEDVTGKNFSELVDEYITKPLKLENTFVDYFDDYNEMRLAGIWRYGENESLLDRTSFSTITRQLVSNVEEYSLIISELYRKGGFFDGELYDELFKIYKSNAFPIGDDASFTTRVRDGLYLVGSIGDLCYTVYGYDTETKHTIVVVSQAFPDLSQFDYFELLVEQVRLRSE